MDKIRRYALFALLLGVILFLGLLFAPFISVQVLQPAALTAWFFLRVFILSIGQKYYWGFVIVVGLFYVIARISQEQESTQPENAPSRNTALRSVESWQASIKFSLNNDDERQTLQRELIQMLVSLYSSRQTGAAYQEVYQPLKQGQIPLPAPIYAYLFPQKPDPPSSFIGRAWQNLRLAVSRKIRRWTGQDEREAYQAIEQVLSFLESSLELTDDDNQSKSDHD